MQRPAAVKVNQALRAGAAGGAGLIAFFIVVRLTLSVEKPSPPQQVAEMIHEYRHLGDQIIGHGYERFQAFVTCIFLFVLLNNLLGLIPGVVAPTSRRWCRWVSRCYVSLLQLPRHPRAGRRSATSSISAGPLWWMALAHVSHRDRLALRA